MITHDLLNVSICTLEPLRVVFRQCVFRNPHPNINKQIQDTFKFLRQWSACMRLNPAEFVEVGIPRIEDDRLISYTCCLEYVLPSIDENADVSLGELPGGRYAVLRVEKNPTRMEQAIWLFKTAYLLENHLQQDPRRPVYEIFHEKELEYCVPVLK